MLGRTPAGRALVTITLYKITADAREDLPSGVRPLRYYTDFAAMSRAFTAPLAVIGGTPGGLYSLVKARAGKHIDWTEKLFDVLVIDEASQMSLPEAVLAGAFLKPGGQVLIVGDHRQMPPILAHLWTRERKRSATVHHPYHTVIPTILAKGFPAVRLDESFRLHQVQAQFLADHIYRHDGFHFYSRRQNLLPALPHPMDPYIAAALQSDFPVVVIEHSEDQSQQQNLLEVELAAPLIAACVELLGLDGARGLGVVVPHRAQKAALRTRFPELAAADAIDTVERYQGGERDVILVSATASDPAYVAAEAAFLLNLNRLNVAISRPRLKLIVLASRTVFRMLVDDPLLFEHVVLWKQLRYNHASQLLWEGTAGQHVVRMYGRHCGHAIPRPAPAIPAQVAIPPPTYARRERRKEAW
jgi:hypothetical protein